MSRADPGRSYSWWSDSHFTAKNSKWLQENLTDMEVKVRVMIKIIEEDADSFARRAEMYYKRRPELMKLVEEFYRAYCALAARYDHATGDLRQAHRTISEAFPDQIPFTLNDDSPWGSSVTDGEPYTPEVTNTVRPLFDPDASQKDSLGGSSIFPIVKKNGVFSEENDKVTGKKTLKQFSEIFQGTLASDKKTPESGGGAASVKLAYGRSRRGLIFQECEEKDSEVKLNGRGAQQRNELNLQDKGTQYEAPCLQAEIENEDDAKFNGLNVALDNQCSKTTSNSYVEGLSKAEAEVHNLQTALAKLQEENHQALKQYHDSLQRIFNLETEIVLAHEEIRSLNEDIFKGIVRFKSAEEQAVSLESKRQSLQSTTDDLGQKFILQQEELKSERNELEKLRIQMQEKCLQSMRHETVFELMTQEHAQLQEQHKGLLLELQNERNVMKDTRNALQHEINCLKEERNDLDRRYSTVIEQMESVKLEVERLQSSIRESFCSFIEEKSVLTEEKDNAATKVDNMMQIMWVLEALNAEIKEKLSYLEKEKETCLHQLKELQDENTLLKESCNKKDKDREVMSHTLKTMESVLEKNCLLEKTLLDKDDDLEIARNKLKSLEESFHSLMEEKLVLAKDKDNIARKFDNMMKTVQTLEALNSEVKEKRICLEREMETLLNQLEELQTENTLLRESCNKKDDENAVLSQSLQTMENFLEKNSLLEKSLSEKSNDLEIVREKLKILEDSFHSLTEEKSLLAKEKDNLAINFDALLQSVQILEALSAEVKEKLLCVEMEKETLLNQLEELKAVNTFLKETCNKKDEENAVMSQSLKLMESVFEKNCLLEKSLSEKNHDWEAVREKLKILEESFHSLVEEKSILAKEKDNIATKFDDMTQAMQILESLNAEVKEKHLCLEREKETLLNQLKELRASLDLEREEHTSIVQSISAKSKNLEARINILLEENEYMNHNLEEEENNVLRGQIEAIVVQCVLLDICVISRDLSLECQKYQEISSHATEMVCRLKERSVEQQMQLESVQEKHSLVVNQNMKLRYGVEQLLALINTDLDRVYPDKIGSEVIFYDLQNEIESLRALLVTAQNEVMQLLLERIITVTLLEQLGLEISELFMNRKALETEGAALRENMIVLQSGKQNLEKINDLSKQKILLLEFREQALENEIGIARRKLHESRESNRSLEHRNHKLHEENRSLSEDLLDLKKRKHTLEEDFNAAIHEDLSLGTLLVIYQSCNVEKENEIRKLNASLDCIRSDNYTLKEEGRVMSDKLKVLEMENSNFRELVEKLEEYKLCSVSLESEVDKFRSACGQLKDQIEFGQKLLNEKELKLSDAEHKLEIMKMEQAATRRELEHVMEESIGHMARKEAMEKDLMELTIVNTGISTKIDRMTIEEEKLKLELVKLQKKIEDLRFQEEHLKTRLKENNVEIERLHTICDMLYCDLQVSDMHCAILEQKVYELIGTCKNLNEHFQEQVKEILDENDSMNAEIDELKQKNALLEDEAEKMKLKFVEYLSVISSLEESIISLEDHCFSLMRIERSSSEDAGSSFYNYASEVDEECRKTGNHKRDGLRELHRLLANIQTIDMTVGGFEIIKREYQELKLIKEALEKQLNNLGEDILTKGNEMKSILRMKENLELESDELLRKIDQFQFQEEYLKDELNTSMEEIELLQRSLETLYHEHESCAIRETVIEKKWKELVGAYESLQMVINYHSKKFLDETGSHSAEIDELRKKITMLEELKEESVSIVSSIKESICSLEYLCLAAFKSQTAVIPKASDAHSHDEKNIRETDPGSTLSGTEERDVDLQELLVKFKNVERLVIELSQICQLHKDKDGRENLEARSDYLEKQKVGVEIHKTKSGATLDSYSSCGSRAGPFGNNKQKYAQADEQMLELWETAEKHCSHETQILTSVEPSVSDADADLKFSIQKENKDKDHQISELQIEREVAVDKIEVSSETEKNKKVRGMLASEANRLMDLKNNVQGLNKRFEKLRKNSDPNGVEIGNAKAELGRTESVILRLIEVNNNKLRKSSHDKCEREMGKLEEFRGSKAEDLPDVHRAQTGKMSKRLEKIDQLEFELQKIEILLRRLEDENVKKQHADVERRARVILRDFLYGRREVIDRKKKGRFCGCIRPSAKDD